MKKKINRFRLVIIVGIMLIIMLIRIYYINAYNEDVGVNKVSQQKWEEYIYNGNKDHPYYLQEELSTVDLLSEYSDIISPTLARSNDQGTQPFIAESSLTYYMEPSTVSHKALQIKKGDTCYGMDLASFYGVISFPSYKKGWRIAVPYATETTVDEYNDILADRQRTVYYVSTKDLKKFSKTYFEQYIWDTYKEQGPGGSFDNLVRAYLFQYDYSLYHAGYYFSPDLFQKKWDIINIVLMIGVILLSLVGVVKKIKTIKQ